MVERAHGFLEEIPCGRIELPVSHIMEGGPVLDTGMGRVCEIGVWGMGRWIREVLYEISVVVKGDNCKLLLDRGEHGLPFGKRMKPFKQGGKMGEVSGNSRVDYGLSNVGRYQGDIEDEGYGVSFEEVP